MGAIRRGSVWYIKWKDASGKWQRKRSTARTKAEAQVLHAEIIRQVDRQLRGLEEQPLETGMTVWGICDWWLENHCQALSYRRAKSFLIKHVKMSELGSLPMRALTSQAIERYFAKLEKAGYAPRTINNFRRLFGGVINSARRAKMWGGENPVKGTRFREVPKEPRPVFKPEEVPLLIDAVAPSWRNYFATAIYLGLRKGELCALRKADYDRARRELYVGRSHRSGITKGKRVDYLPVPSVLAPFLDDALNSPGMLMFPNPKGTQRTENVAPEDIMRAAFRRLGWVEGYFHKCRRCVRGKKGAEKSAILATTTVRANDDAPRHCETCGFKLWPVGIPSRGMRPHDMRHTVATHLLRSGVPIQHVQRILRHKSIKTTVDTYGHLLTDDLRLAVEKLGPQPVQAARVRSIT